MNDRIKLAEAMGWGVGEDTCDGQEIGVPPGDTRPYGQGNLTQMPDPFTDANDDYAVLEWMRTQRFWTSDKLTYFMGMEVGHYTIGDYARAALKVIS